MQDVPFLCYVPPSLLLLCFPCPLISNPISFQLYLLTPERSNASIISTLTLSCYWKKKITVRNFKWCVIHTPLDSQSVYGCNLFQITRALYPSNYLNLLKVLNFRQHLWLLKTQTRQVMSDTVRHYRRLLSDIYGHITSTVCIAVIQNLLKLAISLTLQLTVKIEPFRT